jgi:hypothetical protein
MSKYLRNAKILLFLPFNYLEILYIIIIFNILKLHNQKIVLDEVVVELVKEIFAYCIQP